MAQEPIWPGSGSAVSGNTPFGFYDDESDCAYFLKKGEVEIISKKGTTVGFINEEEVFGTFCIT